MEILKRLGISNKNKLEEVLGFKVNYNEKHTIFDVLSDTPVKRLVESKAQGWRAKLNMKPKRNNINVNLDFNLELPSNNPIKVSGQKFFHKGHILAKEFYPFLTSHEESDKKLKDSNKNGFIQFGVANMQQEKADKPVFRHSQAFYENKIVEYLRAGNGSVLYEVKIFFYNKCDKIPVGTKILCKTLEDKILYHVFIPNFDNDFDLSKSSDYVGVKTYRKFYSKGYDEQYSNCFDNIANIVNDGNLTKTYDEEGNQVFCLVSKNKQDINKSSDFGVFLTVRDASDAFNLDVENISIDYFTKQDLENFIAQEFKGEIKTYYPARNKKKCISAVFSRYETVEDLCGFGMNGLKQQPSLNAAFQKLKWLYDKN